MLSPIAWRTPPRHYGPWEQMASNLTEGLVKKGLDVTLFATLDSRTSAKLEGVVGMGYEEDRNVDTKVSECLHISHLMERAEQFDLIHNHYDFLPLTYSSLINTPMITTIHGFSSEKIIPVYKKYNQSSHFVSISNSDRHSELNYLATVYNGIEVNKFSYVEKGGDYLLFFGRIHPHKGTWEAIQVALQTSRPLIIAGIIQDELYFKEKVEPYLNGQIRFVGHAGPDERNRLLGNAYALLHLISFEEPFGLSVAEAMCCGTPVIAFNRGSMPELIKSGCTGFLVSDINEAAETIPDVAGLKREACRNWSLSQFSSDKMVNDYIRLYEHIPK